VRARLAVRAEDWRWSSVRAHLAGQDDGLVTVGPVLDRIERFADLIERGEDQAAFAAIRAA
jgi:putative transposase